MLVVMAWFLLVLIDPPQDHIEWDDYSEENNETN